MANALTDFTKKREFLICMDSDGCVMDTVRIKHSTVMCPELIRVFALDDHADFITAAWDEINLHTITRGISRFESVRLVFDRLKNRGIEIPGSEDIAAWVDTATELSTASLQRELQKTGSLTTYDQPYQGRNRRYYHIADAGRTALEAYCSEWQQYKQQVDQFLTKKEDTQ